MHRYLEHFKEGGGHWKGKNYTFDKRYAHGADNAEIISNCVHCDAPWERYQASAKCAKCKMEVLLCRRCQRTPKPPKKSKLHCPLCKPGGTEQVCNRCQRPTKGPRKGLNKNIKKCTCHVIIYLFDCSVHVCVAWVHVHHECMKCMCTFMYIKVCHNIIYCNI